MNYTIKLPFSMNSCPAAWQNFFEHNCSGGPVDEHGDITVEYINQQLEDWGGKYDPPTTSLVFSNEGALAWFVLAWEY